jgi:hypothetical protein
MASDTEATSTRRNPSMTGSPDGWVNTQPVRIVAEHAIATHNSNLVLIRKLVLIVDVITNL